MVLRYKVFGSLNLDQYLEKLHEHHHFLPYTARLVTTARAQLLNTDSYVETSRKDTVIQVKIWFLGVGMINKNSLSWLGRGPT